MHGDEKVIQQLNAALNSELTAIVQYIRRKVGDVPELGL